MRINLVLQSHISKPTFALTCMWMRDTFISQVMDLQLDPYVQAHKIIHTKKSAFCYIQL